MKRSILCWLIPTSLIGVFGCASDRIDIHATDHERIIPGAKVSIQIFPKDESSREGLFELVGSPPTSPVDTPSEDPAPDEPNEVDRESDPVPPPTPINQRARRDDSTGLTPQHQEHGTPQRPEPGTRERPWSQPTLAIDLDYRAALGGRDDKSFSAPHYVDYDGVVFDGPQHMRYEFDVQVGSVDARGGLRIADLIALEAMGGVSTSASHVVAHATNIRSGETSVGLGANVGGRVTLMPHRLIDLYAQGQVHVLDGLQQGHDAVVITAGEVGTNFHLSTHVSLFGGWRWMRYDESINHESDVITNLSGPTFGLYIRL